MQPYFLDLKMQNNVATEVTSLSSIYKAGGCQAFSEGS